ncbi:MAG: penicillin acylase family protein [Microcystaceae cyanobacterium]
MNKRLLILLFVTFLSITTLIIPTHAQNSSEILWDRWGVAHIYGKDQKSLFYGFGWSQAQSHGNLLLKLYAQARGRAAEYLGGADALNSDRYVWTMGIPERAEQWYDQQRPEVKEILTAFAQGINDYAKKHPQSIEPTLKAVLPITGSDILAHWQRVIHFHFVTNPQQVQSLAKPVSDKGSNGWAIAPQKSTTGNSLLLANPHTPWLDLFRWYEVHLNSPDFNLYGSTLLGFPLLAIAFNDHLGWTVTVNMTDGADIYELNLKDEGYEWEGETKAFETQIQKIRLKQSDGRFVTLDLPIKRSIHGVIIKETEDKAYALRVVGLDRPHGFKQLLKMAKAQNLNQFETALSELQVPLFNVIYADKKGNIAYIDHAQIPQKSQGDWQMWQGIIQGNTSDTLWTDYHPYEDLPRLVNPETGWVQNTNDPPWTSTFPPILKANDYPAYFAPPNLGEASSVLRTQRSLKMLLETQQFSLEGIIQQKFSSHFESADRLLEIIVPTAKALANPIGIEAAEVLQKWDRQATSESQGALLFTLWAFTLQPSKIFSKPWNPEDPLHTPSGLRDINTSLAVLEGVAAQLKLLYGKIDISWGEAVRFRNQGRDLPASGGSGKLGSFQVLEIGRTSDEKFQGIGGDSFMMAVEFSDPPKGQALMIYGNHTQEDFPETEEQFSLYNQGKMRPILLNRKEIQQQLIKQETIN